MSGIDVGSCFTCEHLDDPDDNATCRACWGHMNYKKKTEENTMGDDGGLPLNEINGFEHTSPKKDTINPDHYKSQTSLECIEAMEITFGRDATVDFCVCNAWKYIWRWKHKNGEEDLRKAAWYLTYAYERITSSDYRFGILKNMIHYISSNGVEVKSHV